MSHIRDLNLSNRIKSCLLQANIVTIDDLVRKDRRSLKNIRGIGSQALEQIEKLLEEQDLYLGMLPHQERYDLVACLLGTFLTGMFMVQKFQHRPEKPIPNYLPSEFMEEYKNLLEKALSKI